MRTVTYDGVITAQSSIAHNGRVTGVTANFRRETLMLPTGSQLQGVPVVSGGLIRGELRRVAATVFQMALTDGQDDRRLPFHMVHALRTGGSLTETRTKGEAINGAKQAKIRSLVPLIGCFGAAGGGRIISGRLIVDKAIPLAKETAFLAAPERVQDVSTLPSIFTLVQREQYSRVADVEDASTAQYVQRADDDSLPAGSGQMLWFQETLLAGTRLLHSITLEDGTDMEAAFLADVIKVFSRKGRIGGGKARGHGRFSADYTVTDTDIWETALVPSDADWRAAVKANREEILTVLEWL